MALFAVVEDATGKLLSIGSVVVDPLPAGIVVLPIVGPPDGIWNPTTRSFTARPPDPVVDRLQDALNHPALAAAWTRLQPAHRTALRKWLVWLLGSRRFRAPQEEVTVDPPNNWPTDPTQVVE